AHSLQLSPRSASVRPIRTKTLSAMSLDDIRARDILERIRCSQKRQPDVRNGSIASFWPPIGHFRLTPMNRHFQCPSAGLKRAMSRPRPNPARYLSGFLAAIREAAVAIECETEMRSQRSDGRVMLRI